MAEYKLPFTGEEIEEKLTFDTTLTQAGKAADAKEVGDRLTLLEAAFSAYITDIATEVDALNTSLGDGNLTEEGA